MVVVTAAVPVEQREELERLAAKRDRTLSYLIRQAVDDYPARPQRKEHT